MSRIELLSPAGSPEGVRAAVQSGANAVYLGFGTFNARRGAKNFTKEEMIQAIAYCRARGVKTNITFNTVATDREREAALCDARFLQEAGADAMIVQDLGLARLLRHHAPTLDLHASTQMTVHTLAGALFAKEAGFSRVVLSRECTLAQIREITARAGIETEVFVHGALCMCYSGQCYLSSVIGQRSGNRGLCAQPCRLAYSSGGGKPSYPLSLKDLSLSGWLSALREAGVSSLKIEGRMKRPEYAAVVTKIFADLLREDRKPTKEEQDTLQKVFSRDGFTDGYIAGHKGDAMFGIKTEVPLQQVQGIYNEAARRFGESQETPLVPVRFTLTARSGEPISLAASDGMFAVSAQAPTASLARVRATTAQDAADRLQKTGGTPFCVQGIAADVGEGLAISAGVLNGLRRSVLDALYEKRAAPPVRPWVEGAPEQPEARRDAFRGYTIEVRDLAQVTEALLETAPSALYVPLTALADDLAQTKALCARLPVAAVLPRVFSDGAEHDALWQMLVCVRDAGVVAGLAGNVGHIPMLRQAGVQVYGDFGLNITNSDALAALDQAEVTRQTVSFELRLSQVRDLVKPMETELIVYGYLPLMVTENCIIRRKAGKCVCKEGGCTLTDRTGRQFALLPEYGCRNTLLNSQPLYLAKRADYARLGVGYARLRMTDESPARCAEIAYAYAKGLPLSFPEGATKGLYFRGVT